MKCLLSIHIKIPRRQITQVELRREVLAEEVDWGVIAIEDL